MVVPVYCNYCQQPAEIVNGIALFGINGRSEDSFWSCTPCKAWVGTHRGSSVAKGTLAKSNLRKLRIMAHSTFDSLWADVNKFPHQGNHRREKAYRWLARQLKISEAECHIGFFDEETCQRVVLICKEVIVKKRKGP